jgi:hypothetical protein
MNPSQATAYTYRSISSAICAAVPTNCCWLVMAMTSSRIDRCSASARSRYMRATATGLPCRTRPWVMLVSPVGSISGSGAVGVVVGKVVAPYLLKHGDRRRAADLLVTNVPGFVGGLFGGVAEYERGGRKAL